MKIPQEGKDMTPSIYDYRSGELENARRICRERVLHIVGGIVAAPFALAAVVAWVIACAVM